MSFKMKNQVTDTDHHITGNEKSFSSMIIVCVDSKFYAIYKGVNLFCCLTSSYFYAYMAAFEEPGPGSFLFTINWTYEAIFIISMIICFLTEFHKDGETTPTRDLKQIANRYLYG